MIPEKMTQKDIANRVGASREMINRILRDLSQGGLNGAADQIIAAARVSITAQHATSS